MLEVLVQSLKGEKATQKKKHSLQEKGSSSALHFSLQQDLLLTKTFPTPGVCISQVELRPQLQRLNLWFLGADLCGHHQINQLVHAALLRTRAVLALRCLYNRYSEYNPFFYRIRGLNSTLE